MHDSPGQVSSRLVPLTLYLYTGGPCTPWEHTSSVRYLAIIHVSVALQFAQAGGGGRVGARQLWAVPVRAGCSGRCDRARSAAAAAAGP